MYEAKVVQRDQTGNFTTPTLPDCISCLHGAKKRNMGYRCSGRGCAKPYWYLSARRVHTQMRKPSLPRFMGSTLPKWPLIAAPKFAPRAHTPSQASQARPGGGQNLLD